MDYSEISKPSGKLGVLIVGLNGAVSTTFVAGVLSVRKGFGKPYGSVTQMGTIRLGNRAENNFPFIKDFVPLAKLDDLVFGGWDIRNENCYDSALEAKVLSKDDLEPIREELEEIEPMPGVFEKRFVVNLNGEYIKKGNNKFELAGQLRQDIRNFKA
ncbi:MAG: inositol-3-phosphate synthase, partial [Clostridiales bacterium]